MEDEGEEMQMDHEEVTKRTKGCAVSSIWQAMRRSAAYFFAHRVAIDPPPPPRPC